MNLNIAAKDLVKVISKSAPILGGIVGGPFASIGITLLSNLFGIDTKDTSQISEKIKLDPDSDIKLKSLELEHKEALAKLSSQNYANEVDDRKSAREREKYLASLGRRDWVPAVISISFLFIYSVVQYLVITSPGEQDDIISARVQDIFMLICGYYFGSSHKKTV